MLHYPTIGKNTHFKQPTHWKCKDAGEWNVNVSWELTTMIPVDALRRVWMEKITWSDDLEQIQCLKMPRRENVKCVSNQYDSVCLSAGKQYVGGVQRPRAMKRVPLMRFSPVWHPKGGKGDLFVVFLQLHISISMGRPCPRGGGGPSHSLFVFFQTEFPHVQMERSVSNSAAAAC